MKSISNSLKTIRSVIGYLPMIASPLLLASVFLLSIFACSDPPPPTLLYEDRTIVDSLYQIEYELIVDSLDANCEQMQHDRLEPMVDSILKVRLVEIIKQKQRYQQINRDQ